MDTNAKQSTPPDWGVIERDYRAGVKPLRTIAEEHGITHGAINKRAKRDEWTRDLRAKIQAKADALVAKAAVSKKESSSPAAKASDRQIVDANATAIVNIRLAHRTDIHRARGVANNLLDELAGQTGPEAAALLEQLGDLLRKPDDKGQDKLNDLYQKVISLPARVKSMKDLGETLRVLVALEREAFGISSEAPKDEGLSGLATSELLKLRAKVANV